MDTGAVLIGIAAAIITAAYISAPLRQRDAGAVSELDAVIEKWITQASKGKDIKTAAPTKTSAERFCNHCGRPIQPDHNYCPGCGTRVGEG